MQKQHLNKNLILIIISYLAFISLGLPDGLLGIAWPFMNVKFGVPLDALGILLISFVAGYLLTSLANGKIMAKIPLGILLALSCSLTGLSLLGYAFANHWYMVIIMSFFLGAGGGAIDASINTFAAAHFSASIVNWLHAFYGIGATTGPLFITWMLVHGQQWYDGYILVGFIQVILSILFLITLRYWKVNADKKEKLAPATKYLETLRMPLVWLSFIIFFLYTGLEIGVGQWIFTILTKSRHLSEGAAGLWVSVYWGSLTVGRMLFGVILTKYPVHKMLIGALTGVVVGALLLTLDLSNFISLIGIIGIGIFNAPVFPSLISITPKRVGEKHVANVIGFQVSAAMIGGALLPGFAGFMINYWGLEVIPKIYLVEAILLLGIYLITSKIHDTIKERVECKSQ